MISKAVLVNSAPSKAVKVICSNCGVPVEVPNNITNEELRNRIHKVITLAEGDSSPMSKVIVATLESILEI